MLLTPTEAAERLGVGGRDAERTIRRHAHLGTLRAVYVRRYLLIDSSSIDELVPWEEAARRLRLDVLSQNPRAMLGALVQDGTLKSVEIGRRTYVRRNSLDRVIAQGA